VHWHGFRIYIGVMNRTSINHSKEERKSEVIYFCSTCEACCKVFVECWTNSSNGPFKIELHQHSDHGLIKIDEMIIRSRPKGKIHIHRIYYCGCCGNPIGDSIDLDYLRAWADYNQNQIGN